MFDLYFYLMISYFFECQNNQLRYYYQKVLSRRGYQNAKKANDGLLLMMNITEQLDNYKTTGFLLYLSNYKNYF